MKNSEPIKIKREDKDRLRFVASHRVKSQVTAKATHHNIENKKRKSQDLEDKLEDFFRDSSPRVSKKTQDQLRDDSDVYAFLDTIKLKLERVVAILKSLPYKKLLQTLVRTTTIAGKYFVAKMGIGKTFAAIFLILLVVLISAVYNGSKKAQNNTTDVQGVAVEAPKPDFEVISSPDILATKFDPEIGVASFEDVIDGSTIVVSQQPVPEEKKGDELFLTEVALASNISKEFSSDKGPLFIGENIKNQVQTVIFRYNDFLIFIQTKKVYDTSILINYVNSL